MKKLHSISVFALLLSAFLSSVAQGQPRGIFVNFDLATPLIVQSCEISGIAAGKIEVRETNVEDFYGDQTRIIYNLHFLLPDGFEFKNGPTNPPTWDAATSNNLVKTNDPLFPTTVQIITNPVTVQGIVYYVQNEISLRGLEVKNMNGQLDRLTFGNLLIGAASVPGPIPTGELRGKIEYVTGTLPLYVLGHPPDGGYTGNQRPMVYGLRDDIFTALPTNFSADDFQYVPGRAEGIVFEGAAFNGNLQFNGNPSNEKIHDVQQQLKGVGTVVPTIRWVDCGNKFTSIPPGSYITNPNTTPPTTSTNPTSPTVTLTLVPSPSTTSVLWDGSGPTYSGAVPTVSTYTTWPSAPFMPLTASIDMTSVTAAPEAFQIVATATLGKSWNAVPAVSNVATSSVFRVARRLINWQTLPALGTPEYIPLDDKWGVPLYAAAPGIDTNPTVTLTNPVDYFQQPFVPVSLSVLPIELPSIGFDDKITGQVYSEFIPSSTTPVSFANLNPAFTLDGSQLTSKPEYDALGYVKTYYFGWDLIANPPAPNVTSFIYQDPRYITIRSQIENNGLPVELVAFGGQMRNEVVTLKWTTATESNNYGFDVERSFDRATWSKVGFVQGNGTTSSQHDYRFEDRLPASDLQNAAISYRLRQIDRDGTTEYSQVVTLSVAPTAEKVTMLQNYPNPFNPTTNISFYLPASDVVTLVVYNELGVEVARVHDNAALESGWHTTSFRAGSLPSGLYAYRLQTGAGSVARTMVVAK